MNDMTDYQRRALSEYIERTGQDISVEEAKPALDEKLDIVDQKLMESADEEQRVDYAIGMLSGEDLREKRVGVSGEPMDIQILSIGHRGVFPDWSQENVDTVMSHAVIRGPLGDDGKEKTAKAILFNKKSNMDVLDVQSKFHALNELEANYEVEPAWDLGKQGFYRAYSTDQTDLVETDIAELPDSRDEKNDFLRRLFDDVPLAELAESKKHLTAFDPDTDNNYTLDWGADIKRFRGTIVDHYIPDDRSFGVYTLMDESVTPEDIEDTNIVGGSGQVPGFTVWCQPDYHMQYGNQSVVDVYGVIETNDDGQIVMRAAGIVPIVPMEMDDGESDGVQATESSI